MSKSIKNLQPISDSSLDIATETIVSNGCNTSFRSDHDNSTPKTSQNTPT